MIEVRWRSPGDWSAGRKMLSDLKARPIARINRVLATTIFVFGSNDSSDGAELMLGIECPWRIRSGSTIVLGSDDQPGEADLRAALLGGAHDHGQSSAMPAGNLVVQSVVVDPVGGLTITLSQGQLLELFPASREQMEWILEGGEQSIVFMNGLMTLTGQGK